MKIQVTQRNLKSALAIVSRVADTRASLPILSNILIKADNNRISLSATNLEVAITRTIGGKIINQGSVTAPAKLLNDYVSTLPENNIDIELEDNKITLVSGKYRSSINTMPKEDFPEIPHINKEAIEVPPESLKQALNQTVFAASKDESRPVLTGVLMKPTESAVKVVATDSYRLAEKTISGMSLEDSVLIPASSAQDILRAISDGQETAQLAVEETQAQFTIGETEIITRLIEGKFPEYESLLPEQEDVVAEVSKSELINIAKTASLFARESAGSITVVISEEDQTLSISSVASQVGETRTEISAKAAGDGDITLNSRFLIEALNAFDKDLVKIKFSGRLKPCIISPVDDNPNYIHVIMPLKT